MPNHVCNKLNILDVDNDTRFRILEAIATRNDNGIPILGTIDFDRIVPMPTGPDFYRGGSFGSEEREKYGTNNWYDWCIEHWGTKWNAYDFGNGGGGADIVFNTAWSTPVPVFEALSKMFPGVHFNIKFADEDIGQNCGDLNLKGATDDDPGFGWWYDMSVNEIEWRDAVRFACEVWGYNPNRYINDPYLIDFFEGSKKEGE